MDKVLPLGRCVRGLLTCGVLGLRHGPRLGAEVGAAAGTVFPVAGNIAGALIGVVVGAPLGFVMGLIGGAIHRRWGWALGGALPGLVLTVALARTNTDGLHGELIWYVVCLGAVPLVGGAWAGWRLGDALENSRDLRFAPFQKAVALGIAPASLSLRLSILFVFALTLVEPAALLWHYVARYWSGQ
jgi:hypothetical protein